MMALYSCSQTLFTSMIRLICLTFRLCFFEFNYWSCWAFLSFELLIRTRHDTDIKFKQLKNQVNFITINDININIKMQSKRFYCYLYASIMYKYKSMSGCRETEGGRHGPACGFVPCCLADASLSKQQLSYYPRDLSDDSHLTRLCSKNIWVALAFLNTHITARTRITPNQLNYLFILI